MHRRGGLVAAAVSLMVLKLGAVWLWWDGTRCEGAARAPTSAFLHFHVDTDGDHETGKTLYDTSGMWGQ